MNIEPYFLFLYFRILDDQPRSQAGRCLYRLNHFFFTIHFGRGIDYHQTYRFDYEEPMFPHQAEYSYLKYLLHLTIKTITTEEFQLALIDLLHYIINLSLTLRNMICH